MAGRFRREGIQSIGDRNGSISLGLLNHVPNPSAG